MNVVDMRSSMALVSNDSRFFIAATCMWLGEGTSNVKKTVISGKVFPSC
jgi:hypothetical protein